MIFGKIALDLGVATHSAPDAELEKVANDLVQRLANGPTLAYGKMRSLIRAWSSGGVSAADIITAQLTAGILDTKDGAEGMAAATAALERKVNRFHRSSFLDGSSIKL
jgi:enoyl-CoA hydratase/carnithine racemase